MLDFQTKLKDGTIVVGDYFEDSDYQKICQIFEKWLSINSDLKSLKGRNLNVPDVVSEALYCYVYGAIRTNGSESHAGSFDAVDIKTGDGVQIKSASIQNDCTSFGPESHWDKLVFMDFCPNGIIDGHIDFYEIKQDLSHLVLNAKSGATFEDQQKAGRRPRLSIKKTIIAEYGLKPDRSIYLFDKNSKRSFFDRFRTKR